jgi:hypothetical protein
MASRKEMLYLASKTGISARGGSIRRDKAKLQTHQYLVQGGVVSVLTKGSSRSGQCIRGPGSSYEYQ